MKNLRQFFVLLCLAVLGTGTMWAETAIFSSKYMTGQAADATLGTCANNIWLGNGTDMANDFKIQITQKLDKAFSKQSTITIDGVAYDAFKNSNGAEMTITLPAGKVATKVDFYATANADADAKLYSFDGVVCSDVVASHKDGANPTKISKDVPNENSFKFCFSTNQVFFVAVVTYQDPVNVTYHSEHGTVPAAETGVTALANPLPSMSEEGYAFLGWYTDQEFTTKAVAGAGITVNTDLYAKWKTGYIFGITQTDVTATGSVVTLTAAPADVTTTITSTSTYTNASAREVSNGTSIITAASTAAILNSLNGTTPVNSTYNDGFYYAYNVKIPLDKKMTISQIAGNLFPAKDRSGAYKLAIYKGTEKLYESDELAYTQNVISKTDMIVDLSAETNLQDLTGTISVRLLWWQAGSSSYVALKDLNITTSFENVPVYTMGIGRTLTGTTLDATTGTGEDVIKSSNVPSDVVVAMTSKGTLMGQDITDAQHGGETKYTISKPVHRNTGATGTLANGAYVDDLYFGYSITVPATRKMSISQILADLYSNKPTHATVQVFVDGDKKYDSGDLNLGYPSATTWEVNTFDVCAEAALQNLTNCTVEVRMPWYQSSTSGCMACKEFSITATFEDVPTYTIGIGRTLTETTLDGTTGTGEKVIKSSNVPDEISVAIASKGKFIGKDITDVQHGGETKYTLKDPTWRNMGAAGTTANGAYVDDLYFSYTISVPETKKMSILKIYEDIYSQKPTHVTAQVFVNGVKKYDSEDIDLGKPADATWAAKTIDVSGEDALQNLTNCTVEVRMPWYQSSTSGCLACKDFNIVALMEDVPAPTGYTRNVTSGKYGTLCLPYAVERANLTGVDKVYSPAGKQVDGAGEPSALVLAEETGDLVAGKPYIFLANADQIVATYTGEPVAAPVDNNHLVGSFTGTTVATGNYVISQNAIHPAADNCTIADHRAYIDLANMDVYVAANTAGARVVVMPLVGMPQAPTSLDAIHANGENVKFMLNGKLMIRHNGQVFDAAGRAVK